MTRDSSPWTRRSGHRPLAWLPEEWEEQLSVLGQPRFRAVQVFRWIHARGVLDPQEWTDVPKALRADLVGQGLRSSATLARLVQSRDGTRKMVLALEDGAAVESVLIPMTKGMDPFVPEPDDAGATDAEDVEEIEQKPRSLRVTQCVSTQVGCALGCIFCATGLSGLQRNLGADEIVEQVLMGRAQLRPDEVLSNVVLMGMGEPLHNYDATLRAIRLLTHADGIGLSHRRVTVSTVGLVPQMERLGRDLGGKVALAISLHAADDATRDLLVPVNRRYPLGQILRGLRAYPLPRRRRFTIEYVMVDGMNDRADDARRLATLLRGLRVKINLIPMNRMARADLHPSKPERVAEFQQVLLQAGYSCFVRKPRGEDIDAACGQLASRHAGRAGSVPERDG